jgi:hypothetical protein
MWFVGQKDSSDQSSDESEDKAENRSSDSEKRPLKKRRKSKGRNSISDDSDNDEGAKAAGAPESRNKTRKSKGRNSISDDSDNDEDAKAACAPEPRKRQQSAHSLLTANSINKVLEEELCSLCLVREHTSCKVVPRYPDFAPDIFLAILKSSFRLFYLAESSKIREIDQNNIAACCFAYSVSALVSPILHRSSCSSAEKGR